MAVVTISSKFQIVIPAEIRKALALRPGQKVEAIVYGDRIELVPVREPLELRGFLRGMDTALEREEERV